MNYIQVCNELGLKLNEPFMIETEVGKQTYKFGNNCLLVGYPNKKKTSLNWAYAYDQLEYVIDNKDKIVKVNCKVLSNDETNKKTNKKPKNYHVVGVRFREELYNKVISEKIETGLYEDISKYIKELIENDLSNKTISNNLSLTALSFANETIKSQLAMFDSWNDCLKGNDVHLSTMRKALEKNNKEIEKEIEKRSK